MAPKISRFGRIKETYQTSTRLVRLVWAVDQRLFLATILITLIPAVIPFVNAYIYKLLIDAVVASTSGTNIELSYLLTLGGARLLTYFIQDIAFKAQDFFERLLWTKFPIHLNQLIFGKIAELDVQYFEDSDFKNLLERVRESYTHRPQKSLSYTLFLFQNILQLSIAFIAIIALNPWLLILALLVTVPEFINQTKLTKASWTIWWSDSPARKRFTYRASIMQDANQLKEIRLFGLAKTFLNEIKKVQHTFYLDNAKISKRHFTYQAGFSVIGTGMFIGVEGYVLWLALAKRISIGDISFYTQVVTNFQNGLGGLFRNINGIFENILYLQSIFELLDTKPVIIDKPNATQISFDKPPAIEFRNVSFTYPGSGKATLRNVSFTINPGEKIAFVGENGAGKSTIVKLLVRFYDVTEGAILIDGHDLREINRLSWHRHVGVLFQDFNRYEDTAKSNIHYGNISADDTMSAIEHAAELGGAHEMINSFTKGYDQMVGRIFEDGIELSTGQWQKMALSRAFFRNAPILILDEPTASIDAKAEAEIFERIQHLTQDKTVIIISHRFSTVRHADTIFVIQNGTISESGNHKQLMQVNKQYASMFDLQAKGYQ